MEMKHSQKFLWLFLAAACLLGLVWQFYPLEDASKRIASLPLNGRGYIGKDVPLSNWEKEFFKNVNVVKRLYQVNSQSFFITALDGTKNRHVVHDPTFCFKGGGWEIIDEKRFTLPSGEAALITLKKGKETQEALYWFTDAKVQYASSLYFWWQTILRRLSLGKAGEEPMLVVVQPVTSETVDWKQFFSTFRPIAHL